MNQQTRNTMHNVMENAITDYKKAVDDLAKIHAEKDTTAEAKTRQANKVAENLTANLNGLQKALSAACSDAADAIEAARAENSDRLNDYAYQARVLGEAAFFRDPPDTMTTKDVEKRLSAFFGDETARPVLMGSLLEASENRKARGVDGFPVERLFPDVYGLQATMLDKIQKAISDRLNNLAASFLTGADPVSVGKNAFALAYAEGTFQGVGLYIDRLPEKVKWGSNAATARQYNIPAFAGSFEDLGIIFSMYRG